MDRLRNSIEHALREAERLSQPPSVAAQPAFPPAWRPAVPLDREGQDAEPLEHKAVAVPSPAPPLPAAQPLDLRAILRSRAALRQAFLLREILGPPRALQDPHGEGRM